MRIFSLAVGLLALSAGATGVSAAGNAASGLQAMRETNLIVLGDMHGGDDVEGRTFVGGSLSNAATYGLGRSGQAPLASTRPTLTVRGSVTGTANINGGVSPSGATVGGSIDGVNLNASNAVLLVGGAITGSTNGGNGATIKVGGGLGSNSHPTGVSVQSGLGSAFTNPLVADLSAQTVALTANLQALSAMLAALPATGTFDLTDPNNATFKSADPGLLGYSVIDITAAQLQSANSLIYSLHALPTIINVVGLSVTDNANSNNSAFDNDVLFNFETATSVVFNRQVNGSVLAPFATISNSTPIEGSVAVGGFNQGGEVHQFAFSSPLTSVFQALSPVGVVPEPAAWAMMLAGFALSGALLRARRRAAA